MRAETYINYLKKDTDRLWINFGNSMLLQELTYADKEYGLMQRAELLAILEKINVLKTLVDNLSEDCANIPTEYFIEWGQKLSM